MVPAFVTEPCDQLFCIKQGKNGYFIFLADEIHQTRGAKQSARIIIPSKPQPHDKAHKSEDSEQNTFILRENQASTKML